MATFRQSDLLTLTNPAGLYDPSPFGYSHVAEVSLTGKLVVIAGQGGALADGTYVAGFREQVARTFHNLLTALGSAGAGPRDVVKFTVYIVDHTEEKLAIYGEEARAAWGEVPPPTGTLISVPRLALDDMLVEIEAMAVVAA